MKIFLVMFMTFAAAVAQANVNKVEKDFSGYLVKFKDSRSLNQFSLRASSDMGVRSLKIGNWVKIDLDSDQLEELKNHPDVVMVEKNKIVKVQTHFKFMQPQYQKQVAQIRNFLKKDALEQSYAQRMTDNPDFPNKTSGGSGDDPEFAKQWGMNDIGVKEAWAQSGTKGNGEIVVAVIDTGVDYTHEDLVDNMFRHPGESGLDAAGNDKATNGIDDDGNGYVDDLMGWDFAANDNKPYDLSKSLWEVLTGGNPGHGTHCAGNVAASADNGKGIVGVAPDVKIMAMRFLTENGQGTLEGAINSIRYAVDNGANVLSNSWGSEGDGGDAEASKALQEAIQYSQDKGVLFVAAAGNGHQGVGYDNDTDSRPAYPASYPQDIIVSVAALDSSDKLGSFSNWGRNSVDIGAPGVKVMSTVPGNRYQDTVIPFLATWDGTSMATPHVAGAAALYLSTHPQATWQEVKDALLKSASPISALNNKSVSGGKLNVRALMELL